MRALKITMENLNFSEVKQEQKFNCSSTRCSSGVTHSNDPLREYLDEMRLYMPKEHRELLNGLDEWSENKRKNLSIDEKSRMIINEIINEVHTFRDKHLEYARVYIFEQSLTNNSNSNIVGTGGTPFMKYLDKHLQETVPSND